MGLGAALFALAATAGATITAFHHQWPGSALLDRASILGASLCVLWAALGRICSPRQRVTLDRESEYPPSRAAETFFAFAFLTGSVSTVALVLPLVRTTWFRLVVDPLAPIVALTWPGLVVIGGLMVATVLSHGASPIAEVQKQRHPAVLLALAGLTVWWTSFMTPSASLLGEIPESGRLFWQPGWWTWTMQLQIGLAGVLVFAALLQDRQYRSRRRRAWPDSLGDLISPSVGFRLAAVHRTRHLQFQENHRHRTGYVDNLLPRVPAHTHCATTTANSLRNPMVDPLRTFVAPGTYTTSAVPAFFSVTRAITAMSCRGSNGFAK